MKTAKWSLCVMCIILWRSLFINAEGSVVYVTQVPIFIGVPLFLLVSYYPDLQYLASSPKYCLETLEP